MKKRNKADSYHTASLHRLVFFLMILFSLYSCSVNKQVSKTASTILLRDSAVNTGHIGICIYEPATNKYWYDYNSSHYFIPASNTKLFTLYAGMKYLGDSLPGWSIKETKDTITLCFKQPGLKKIKYQAGQYLSLSFRINGRKY